jgi:hypothetical protein
LVAVTLITVQPDALRVANPSGVLKTIKGHSGATRTTAGNGFLSPQARSLKEAARSSALAEKDLAFYVKRFH